MATGDEDAERESDTALAACLDEKIESTFIASKIATTEILVEAGNEIVCGLKVSCHIENGLFE